MFTFDQRPGKTDIKFDGDVILTFIDEHVMFRSFVIANLKCRPHGPVELIGLLPTSFYGSKLLRCDVQCSLPAPNRISILLTPTKVDAGLDAFVKESRHIDITYQPDQARFRYEFTADHEILQDIRGKEGVHINPMPQWGKDNYAVLEFDDPLLSGGVGPQVPMTQDWTGLPEPILGADNYTTRWTKRYLSVSMQTVERGHQRLVFNRIVNGVQQFYNRHVLKCAPRTPYYYEKTDGRYLRYSPPFENETGHHICEWGYDMHFYALLPKAGKGKLLTRGQKIRIQYELEEVEAAEVPGAFRNAPAARLEPRERVLADLAIYEEPVCRFTASVIDHPDAYGWEGTKGCIWNRAGGRQQGFGALEVRNGRTPKASEWLFRHFGPSYGGNPIPPASRFRVSAWVRADDIRKVKLTFTTMQFNGSAMYSRRVPIRTTGGARNVQSEENGWRYIEFISKPSGSYSICGEIAFAYAGIGAASMTELSVVRL